MDSIIFPPKKLEIQPFEIYLLQTPPAPSEPPAPPAPPASPAQTGEAQAYILTFIPDWLFQMRTAASGTEAESIRLFRTSLSFRVQQNIFPLLDKMLGTLFSSTIDPLLIHLPTPP